MGCDEGRMQREVITRQEAIEKGLRHYFTGKTCINGHVEKRYTSTGTCVQCMKDLAERTKRRIQERRAGLVTKKETVAA